MNTTTFQAGFAKRPLDIPADTPLGGYAAVRHASGQHDPRMTCAACFEKDGRRLLLFSLDLLACDHLLIDQTKSALEKEGVEIDRMIMTCTHTHSACAGILDTAQGLLRAARHFAMDPDRSLIESIAAVCAQAAREASGSLAPASLSLCSYPVSGIASNRVDPDGPVPETCTLLRIDTPRQHALLSFFGCHPTVLDGKNMQLSADWIGSARQALFRAGWKDFFFFNGAAGDLSCRHTRKESSFEEADRLGSIFAGGCWNTWISAVRLMSAGAGYRRSHWI